jgi:hypothetical protein
MKLVEKFLGNPGKSRDIQIILDKSMISRKFSGISRICRDFQEILGYPGNSSKFQATRKSGEFQEIQGNPGNPGKSREIQEIQGIPGNPGNSRTSRIVLENLEIQGNLGTSI